MLNTLSKKLSEKSTNKPPIIKPIDGSTHSLNPSSNDKSNAGDKSDQKDDAIITPALNPKIVSSTFLFISLKKQTKRLVIEAANELENAINSSVINQYDLPKAYMILVELKLEINKVEDAKYFSQIIITDEVSASGKIFLVL